jgi:hypothetical protein
MYRAMLIWDIVCVLLFCKKRPSTNKEREKQLGPYHFFCRRWTRRGAAIGGTAQQWAVGCIKEVRFPPVGSPASIQGEAAAWPGQGASRERRRPTRGKGCPGSGRAPGERRPMWGSRPPDGHGEGRRLLAAMGGGQRRSGCERDVGEIIGWAGVWCALLASRESCGMDSVKMGCEAEIVSLSSGSPCFLSG